LQRKTSARLCQHGWSETATVNWSHFWHMTDCFCSWNKEEATLDRDTARPQHGCIIRCAGCPIVWKPQLQTEMALSSTESEHTGLSHVLREVTPIMELLKEMQSNGATASTAAAKVHCKVFKDNSGALEMAKVHKHRPRTKNLNNKLRHFRSHVESGAVTMHPMSSAEMVADCLAKPVPVGILTHLRKQVTGW